MPGTACAGWMHRSAPRRLVSLKHDPNSSWLSADRSAPDRASREMMVSQNCKKTEQARQPCRSNTLEGECSALVADQAREATGHTAQAHQTAATLDAEVTQLRQLPPDERDEVTELVEVQDDHRRQRIAAQRLQHLRARLAQPERGQLQLVGGCDGERGVLKACRDADVTCDSNAWSRQPGVLTSVLTQL